MHIMHAACYSRHSVSILYYAQSFFMAMLYITSSIFDNYKNAFIDSFLSILDTQSSRAESQHRRKSRGNRTCRRYIIFSMISSVCLTLCYLDLLHKSDSQIDWADHWKNNVMTTCPVSPGFSPVLWLGPAGLWSACYWWLVDEKYGGC